MSSGEQILSLYNQINTEFSKTKLLTGRGYRPEISFEGKKLTSETINNILRSCVQLYNQIDSMIETFKLTVPKVYEEQKTLIEIKVLGVLSKEQKVVEFEKPVYSSDIGTANVPHSTELPLGIKRVIDLLTESFEYLQSNKIVNCDQSFYTAKICFCSLKAALTRLLGRFNYIMMYPHRLLIDRKILEIGLRKNDMNNVIDFIQSAEEHFNNKKYVEFCAISRNALEGALKKACLILEGEERGFSENRKILTTNGFLKGTISKQMKEFSGSLSAYGGHPPPEKLTNNEAKFLLDSLYSFLGFIALRLSEFKKETKKAMT